MEIVQKWRMLRAWSQRRWLRGKSIRVYLIWGSRSWWPRLNNLWSVSVNWIAGYGIQDKWPRSNHFPHIHFLPQPQIPRRQARKLSWSDAGAVRTTSQSRWSTRSLSMLICNSFWEWEVIESIWLDFWSASLVRILCCRVARGVCWNVVKYLVKAWGGLRN